MKKEIILSELNDANVTVMWQADNKVDTYNVYWADAITPNMTYKLVATISSSAYTLNKATHVPHYIKVEAIMGEEVVWTSEVFETPIKKVFNEQIEKLNRGLVAVSTGEGIFLSWRLMLEEVDGYGDTGMTGVDFEVYRNDQLISLVTDSTNYIDLDGGVNDYYLIKGIKDGRVVDGINCKAVKAFSSESNYIDIPIQQPEGGTTLSGESYTYNANDMSVGDVDGDGDYEYIVKWDPTNSHDVSHKGYTGRCYIDCYKLDGSLLWRLDMGRNIRAGAHYTQFMVYDFDGDGKAEMSVKTAPGTKMTRYDHSGNVLSESYVTIPMSDREAGVKDTDDYVCNAESYREHMVEVFRTWHDHEEVVAGNWPDTLEACFGIEGRYSYPLKRKDAEALVDYFINEYAPSRSEKNDFSDFEGFVYEGPEYLTIFSGDGKEMETIPFVFPRGDDGLMWGDYAMKRIEPCNRVDRFLSGVAYLDGEHPYLIIARGYYTRTAIAAYRIVDGKHETYFAIDSGHVPLDNPFCSAPHEGLGTDPVYGIIAGQGNHSLATADVDGDGYQEIIFGACVIDHDGSVLYSSHDSMPDGRIVKLGHGDAMHVAKIDPDRPGLQMFNVFEGGIYAPYGYALRDAENGETFFGEFAEVDLGRCMIGDITPGVRGLQCWVNETFDCKGNKLDVPLLGTNQSIRWAGDMSTQIIDGVDYIHGNHHGVINDTSHGKMLIPKGVSTNNGTKGNPCLIADVFGDFREELLVRTEDNSAIRIFTNCNVTDHKLFTLMHDIQYRTGIAWQNNCYNQPGYTKFYYASDMDWSQVLPQLKKTIKTSAGESLQKEPVLIGEIDYSRAGAGCKILLGDINGDGRMEMVCVQADYVEDNRYEPHQITCVTAFDLDGKLLWQQGEPIMNPGKTGSDFPAQVVDIDGDGQLEVLCVMDKRFLVLDGETGRVKKDHPLPAKEAHDCIIVANLLGNGPREIILKDRYEQMWAMDIEFNLLWTHKGNIGHFPWASDIDGDGFDEVMAGYDLLDHQGNIRWSCKDLDDHADCLWVGDVNGDGNLEIAVGGSVTCLYDVEGNELWRYEGSIESQHIALGKFVEGSQGLQMAGLDRIIRGDGYKGQWDGMDGMFLLDSKGNPLWKEIRKSKGWLTIVDTFRNWSGEGKDHILSFRRGGGELPALYDGNMNKVVTFPYDGYVIGADLFGRSVEDVVVYANNKACIYSGVPYDMSMKPSGVPLVQTKKMRTSTLYPGGDYT